MIFRMRIYRCVATHEQMFNAFFRDHLLPLQTKYGAELVGRWRTDDDRIVAIWRYASLADYQRIQDAVTRDPDSISAQALRGTLPVLFDEMEQVFMESTL